MDGEGKVASCCALGEVMVKDSDSLIDKDKLVKKLRCWVKQWKE